MAENTEDAAILDLIRVKDSQNYGFGLLVRKYQERLYHHIRRMLISHEDTDDVLQTVFIKAWQNIDSFRSESGIYTWLYRIATNECITFLNKKKKRFFIPMENVERKLSNQLEADESFKGDEIQKKLLKALLTLPEKQRAVFNLKYFEELKYEEIADITGTSVGALKASYHLAVKKIEEYMSND